MQPARRAWATLTLLLTTLGLTGCASDPVLQGPPADLNWTLQSEHPYGVYLEFYSQNRNAAWPGGGRAYMLTDDDEHTFTINCIEGEKICYGAWSARNDNIYWGVGRDDTESCDNCCRTCGDESYEVRVLK